MNEIPNVVWTEAIERYTIKSSITQLELDNTIKYLNSNSHYTDFSFLFYKCILMRLDISKLNTSWIENMSSMFKIPIFPFLICLLGILLQSQTCLVCLRIPRLSLLICLLGTLLQS